MPATSGHPKAQGGPEQRALRDQGPAAVDRHGVRSLPGPRATPASCTSWQGIANASATPWWVILPFQALTRAAEVRRPACTASTGPRRARRRAKGSVAFVSAYVLVRGDGARHVRDAVVDDAVDDVGRVGVRRRLDRLDSSRPGRRPRPRSPSPPSCPSGRTGGRGSARARPRRARRRRRGRRSCTRVRMLTGVAVDRRHVRRHHVVEVAQAVEVDVEDRDVGAEARRHLRRVRAHDAAAEDRPRCPARRRGRRRAGRRGRRGPSRGRTRRPGSPCGPRPRSWGRAAAACRPPRASRRRSRARPDFSIASVSSRGRGEVEVGEDREVGAAQRRTPPASGSLTFMIISAFAQRSLAVGTISAPASLNSWSVMPLPRPAVGLDQDPVAVARRARGRPRARCPPGSRWT